MNASKFYHIQVNTAETKTRYIFYSVKVLVFTFIKTKLCILSYTKKTLKKKQKNNKKPPPKNPTKSKFKKQNNFYNIMRM